MVILHMETSTVRAQDLWLQLLSQQAENQPSSLPVVWKSSAVQEFPLKAYRNLWQ